MTIDRDNKAASGARHVEEQEHITAGIEVPETATMETAPSILGESTIQSESTNQGESTRTNLGSLTLSMFTKGQYVRVRVGSAHNATELYEHAYASADEANTALLDAGILSREQVPNPLEPAGTGIALGNVTAEQLEEAGLKRHLGSSL